MATILWRRVPKRERVLLTNYCLKETLSARTPKNASKRRKKKMNQNFTASISTTTLSKHNKTRCDNKWISVLKTS